MATVLKINGGIEARHVEERERDHREETKKKQDAGADNVEEKNPTSATAQQDGETAGHEREAGVCFVV